MSRRRGQKIEVEGRRTTHGHAVRGGHFELAGAVLNKISQTSIVRDLLFIVDEDNKGDQISNIKESNVLVLLLVEDRSRKNVII